MANLSLANPDYGTPSSVDLLGADMFSRVVLHGWRFGPSGTPSAFKTQFGWVLTASIRKYRKQHHVYCGMIETVRENVYRSVQRIRTEEAAQ